MTLIYGAKSKIPSNIRLTNGYNLYDWVMRKSCYPSFWGRRITGEGAIDATEIDFLKSKNCKIALTIGNLSEVSISGNSDSDIAMKAIESATKIGIPQNKGIALFAEINPEWSVNHNWMIDFACKLINNGYLPGFIGNTDSSKNFNFGRQCSHYVQATRDAQQLHAIYWATEPKYSFEPDIWAPYAPSELLPQDMHLWSYGTIDFHSIQVKKCYARDSSIMTCFL